MKKRNLTSLQLNKKSIANFNVTMIKGGSETLINFNCRLTNQSFCECGSEPCNTHTIYDCDLGETEHAC